MEIDADLVTSLASQADSFANTWNSDHAEEQMASNIATYRAPNQRVIDGVVVDTTDAKELAQVEAAWRSGWDTKAREAGLALELQIASTLAVLEDVIQEQQQLRPSLDPPVTRLERQNEELLALWVEDKWRARLATMTRAEALEVYRRADENVQADRRMVALVETAWPTLAFRDDPATDAVAIPRWQAAREARQRARVQPDHYTWRATLQRAGRAQSLTGTMEFLRSGRSLAVKPYPRAMSA